MTGTGAVPESAAQTDLVVGLLASPGPAAELTAGLVAEVADRLAAQLPGARWKVEFVIDRLVEPPTDLAEVISAGRRMLLDRGWHLVVCVTDLPLQTARRPVIAHVSAAHGVAVLSLPALGPVAVRRRAVETIVRLAGQLLGDTGQAADGGGRRRPQAQVVHRQHGKHSPGPGAADAQRPPVHQHLRVAEDLEFDPARPELHSVSVRRAYRSNGCAVRPS